jgi:hypothetical protein
LASFLKKPLAKLMDIVSHEEINCRKRFEGIERERR